MHRALLLIVILVTSCATFAAAAQSTRPARITDPAVLAQMRQDLLTGSSAKRMEALGKALPAWEAMNESFVEAFEAAAKDPDLRVRREVARTAGNRFVWSTPTQNDRAIRLMQKLATEDEDSDVRYNAVYFGLSTVRQKDEATLRALMSAAFRLPEYEHNLHGRIAWGIRDVPVDRLDAVFTRYFDEVEREPEKALLALQIYAGATKREPPDVAKLDGLGRYVVQFVSKRRGAEDTRRLDEAFYAVVPKERVEKLIPFQDRTETGGLALVRGWGNRREVMRRLGESQEFRVLDDVIVANARVMARLEELETRAKQATAVPASPKVSADYEQAFRDLYDTVGRTYPNFELKQIDWKRVGEEMLPRVRDVKNDDQFGLLCMELVARLEDSHAVVAAGTAKLPAVPFPAFSPGFACLLDDRRRPVVFHVDAEGPAHRAGVKPGMTVLAVDGVGAEDVLRRRCVELSRYAGYSSRRLLEHSAARLLVRAPVQDQTVHLVLETPTGERLAVQVPASMGSRYIPRLPVPIPNIHDSANVSRTRLDDKTGYIYLRRIQNGLEASLDQALKGLSGVEGLILDLRGNTGGGFETRTAFVNFDPEGKDPSRPTFTGPMALLLDEGCISAGEGYGSWFVAKGRAKTFGTATAGASAAKTTYTLTNGLFKVTYPVRAYTGFLSRPIERRGLEPDVPVRQKARDLDEGRDTVLEAARAYLKRQVR